MTTSPPKIAESRRGRVAVLTLNRPEALNALDSEMIEGIGARFAVWKNDESVAAVFLESASEKAFCAGGDVRRLGQVLLAGGRDSASVAIAAKYFADEFFVDHAIHAFPKPVIAWANRITMGGGIGLFAGASHRIAATDSVFAMPEIAIGYFPDVGATWFLNRMPEHIGLFLAITAARFSGADALHLGLATHCMLPQAKPAVLAALEAMTWTGDPSVDNARVRTKLRLFGENVKSELAMRAPTLRKLPTSTFADLDGAITALDPDGDEWLADARAQYLAGSPTSRRVIFEQMRRGRELTKREAFELEWMLATNFALRPDFAEGIRAVLIDKDKNPQWDPASAAEVSDALVDSFFHLPAEFPENQLALRFRNT